MCDALKREKAEAEKKLGNVRGVGYDILGLIIVLIESLVLHVVESMMETVLL